MPDRTKNIIILLNNPQHAHFLTSVLVRKFQKLYVSPAEDAEKSEWIFTRGTNQ